jgi:hypothetical protein
MAKAKVTSKATAIKTLAKGAAPVKETTAERRQRLSEEKKAKATGWK